MEHTSRIEKLIRLTHSSNDHEALLALRLAQEQSGGDLLEALKSLYSGSSNSEIKFDIDQEFVLDVLKLDNKYYKKKITILEKLLSSESYSDQGGYKYALQEWCKIFIRKTPKSWCSTADIKSAFDQDFPALSHFSSNFFSRCFSDLQGISSTKNGVRKQERGYSVEIGFLDEFVNSEI